MPPISFTDWTEYYLANRDHFSELDWAFADDLSDAEYELLFETLQQFQRGEYSEGKNLMRYANVLGDTGYLDAVKLFIREEQMHARVLGRFMDANDIPRIQGHWVDSVFRRLRKLASLVNSIRVLLTAEIIAAVFYKALYNASQSGTLRMICRQILSDEEMHINFQAFTLKKFRDEKSVLGRAFDHTFRQVLLAGTVGVVWMGHRRVLRAGGYNFGRFWRECFAEFSRVRGMIGGRTSIGIRRMYRHVEA